MSSQAKLTAQDLAEGALYIEGSQVEYRLR